MQLVFIHPKTRQRITIPATQVVVTDDAGRPLAISYENDRHTIVHADLNDSDFAEICQNIGMKAERPEIIKLK
jgi:hypothetical protein